MILYITYLQKLAFAKSKSDIVAKSEGIAAAAVKSSKRQREADQATEGSNKEQRIIAGSSVPNKIILAQNLPPNFDGQMLGALFQQCPGTQVEFEHSFFYFFGSSNPFFPYRIPNQD